MIGEYLNKCNSSDEVNVYVLGSKIYLVIFCFTHNEDEVHQSGFNRLIFYNNVS